MGNKTYLTTFLFILLSTCYAAEGFVIINSNEVSSSVFSENKFIGLTPLKVECSKDREINLSVVSSLSGQKFQRLIPNCSFFEKFKADKFLNIVFDEETFIIQKEKSLISSNILEKKKSRTIASAVELNSSEVKTLPREESKGYYLQFLSLPFSNELLGKSRNVLREYKESLDSQKYSYCVKKEKERDWVSFSYGPFNSVKEANKIKENFPSDSFISFHSGC